MVQPPNARRSCLGLTMLGLVLVAIMVVQVWVGSQNVDHDRLTLDAIQVHQLGLARVTSLVAQAERGDERSLEAALDQLDLARAALGELLQLGPSQGWPTAEPEVDAMRSELKASLRELDQVDAHLRACAGRAGSCGSVSDLLASAAERGGVLEIALRRQAADSRDRQHTLRVGALVASLLLELGVGTVLASWERAWTRAFSTIWSYNARLAGEIEKRRLVEAGLRESEERFRLMADGAPMLMWMTDHDLSVVFVNQTWLDFVGRPRESQLGHGWKDSIFPEDRQRIDKAQRMTLASRTPFQAEYRFQRFDGEYRWLLNRGAPRFDGDGTFVGYIGSCVDITERRRTESALRESEGRFRAITLAAYDPVFLIDDRGWVTHWNPAAEKVFGQSESEVLGRPFADVLLPVDQRGGARAIPEQLRGGGAQPTRGETLEIDLLHISGRRVPVDLSLASVTLGGRWHAVAIARDMTERRRREAVETLLREVAEAVVEGQDSGSLLASLCRRVVEVFGVDNAFIALQAEDGRLAVVARHGEGGPAGEGAALPDLARRAFESGRQAVELRDPPDAGDTPVSALAIPVLAGRESLGVMQLEAARPDVLDLAVTAHLRNVAAQVGVALARARDQQELRLHGTALAAVANAIFITDRDGVIRWVNPAFTELSGYTEDEVLGRKPSLLCSGAHPPAFYQTLWETVRRGLTWRGELIERSKAGALYTVYQTITPLSNASGQQTHFIAVQTDITQQRQAEERLRHRALHDELTGLANRALFARHLRRAIAGVGRGGEPFAVLFLDLDRFKDVNDTLGHPVGDLLLREVADRIARTVRPADTVARFGGDEFAILQTGLRRASDAAALCQKLITSLSLPFQLGNHTIYTGASVGVAVYDEAASEPEHLLVQADTALYKAKEEGRATYRFHTEKMQREVVERVRLTQELRRAVDEGELRVLYQPQVDITSDRIIGMEALVRWQHPQRGLLLPGRFISVAEDSGIIVALGEWVLRQVCRTASAWHAAGLCSVPVAVNLSPVQFKTPDLAGRVIAVLDDSGLPASALELEITESVLAHTSEKLDQTLGQLHQRGVRFCIDDFGTGYSSLATLRRFPIHKLKIPQEFVRNLVTKASDAAIVSAVVGLSRALDLRVIAEGVETEEQVRFLERAGCLEAQGFYYHRPMPADAMAQVLLAQRQN